MMAKLPREYADAARASIVAYRLQINAIDTILEFDDPSVRIVLAARRESDGRLTGEIHGAPTDDMIIEALSLLRSSREDSIRVLSAALQGEETAGRVYGAVTPESAAEIERRDPGSFEERTLTLTDESEIMVDFDESGAVIDLYVDARDIARSALFQRIPIWEERQNPIFRHAADPKLAWEAIRDHVIDTPWREEEPPDPLMVGVDDVDPWTGEERP